MSAAPIDFLGIPIDSIGRSGGTELAPRILRDLGLLTSLRGRDLGDLSVSIRDPSRDPGSGIVGYADVLEVSKVVRSAVAGHLADGRRLFLAGGCCTQMIGAMAGTRDAIGRAGIVYLDGHLDLYDGTSSPSGEAADIPLAVMLGHGPQELLAEMEGASLLPEDVALLGYRDLAQAAGYGSPLPADFGPDFTHADTAALRRNGLATMATAIAGRYADRQVPYWLFLDLDVLDPTVFPATDAFVEDGLTWSELADVMQPFLRSDLLLGLALTCYNPEKDLGYACGREIAQHFNRLMKESQ